MIYEFLINRTKDSKVFKYHVDSSITQGTETDVSKDTAIILTNLLGQMNKEDFEVSDGGLFTLIYNSIQPYPLLKGVELINQFLKDTFEIAEVKELIVNTIYINDKYKHEVKIPKNNIPMNNVNAVECIKIPCNNNGSHIIIICKDRIFIAHRKASDKDLSSPNRICVENKCANEFFRDLALIDEKVAIWESRNPKLYDSWKEILTTIYNNQKDIYLKGLK